MEGRTSSPVLVAGVLVLGVMALPASAQVTTATVAGQVRDAQRAAVPGATVTLISETRGTTLGEAVTNESGDYVFPNVTGDTYTIHVTLQGFKAVTRPGVVVSPGDRVVVPALTLEVGGLDEEVQVIAETPLIQAQSGERSFTVERTTVENVPISDRNFATLAQLTPGVMGGAGLQTQSGQQASRIGGGGYNNVMMDGVSIIDVGNNGQMLDTNVEAIGEIKVLTSGYQAEYGRASGLQITAVTKSGTNEFRGSLYDIERDSDLNANSWRNTLNGDPKEETSERDWGYTIGGPVGKPGGDNKLFFFYAHEFRPRGTSGAINRFRVPTALERQGDFSQSRDRNGNLVNLIRDPASGLPCTPADTRGCFQAGGVLGRIPEDRLDPNGLAVLDMWPEPNAQGLNFNYEAVLPDVDNLIQQPTIRIDYQASDKWRFTGKYSGQRERVIVRPALGSGGRNAIPGFNDIVNPKPFIHTLSATANYTINATTFFEATYGLSQNTLAGGRASGGVLVSDASNRFNTGLGDLPLLFPDAGVVDPDTYTFGALEDTGTPFFQDGRILLPPLFQFGNAIGNAPPNLEYPGFFNINRTQDVSASLTKVIARHTLKVGFFLNHSWKAQNLNTPTSFQGTLNFADDVNNPLDTGFGFANAAVGTFSSFSQRSTFVEGSFLYNNVEWYVQDNWKLNNRLTLDYGVRFTHQQPQYDQLLQSSNFFPDQWSAAAAPALFQAACADVSPCSGDDRQARNPVTGKLLGPGSAALIAQIVPGSGDLANGIRQAGDEITKYTYEWPTIAVAPRLGVAYDLTGGSRMVLRGAWGLFFDRPGFGNGAMQQVGNPPNATSTTVRFGQLQNLADAPASQGVPQLRTYRFENDALPTSSQWNLGLQMAAPWSATLDISYAGQRAFNSLNQEQSGIGATNLNAIDFGAAFLPENQDPTLAPSEVPGATALPTELLRPFTGFAEILEQQQEFWRESHVLQFSFQRRFRDGIAAGLNYNLTLSDKGTFGVPLRVEHGPDGRISIRDDQAEFNDLMDEQNTPTHIFRGNWVWDLPDVRPGSGGPSRVVSALLNDWQLSGIWTGASGTKYTVGYSYRSNGNDVNLTGSPDYSARVRIVGDPGTGCSDDRFRQFHTEAFAGPLPGSLGLESGRNYMTGCRVNIWDMALARNFRLGSTRNLQVRLEVFNVFNNVAITNRNTSLQLDNPTDQNVLNAQFNEDGSVNRNRLRPASAGFGAATDALALRSVQLQFRLSF